EPLDLERVVVFELHDSTLHAMPPCPPREPSDRLGLMVGTPHALDFRGAVLLAQVERSGFVESQHLGAAVVTAPDGSILESWGSVDSLVYPRSSLKPFQATAVLRTGTELDPEQT